MSASSHYVFPSPPKRIFRQKLFVQEVSGPQSAFSLPLWNTKFIFPSLVFHFVLVFLKSCWQDFLSGPLLFCLPVLSNCQKLHSASPELWQPRWQEIQSLSFGCKYCGEIIGALTSSLFKHLRQLTDQYAISFEGSATDQSEAHPLFFL